MKQFLLCKRSTIGFNALRVDSCKGLKQLLKFFLDKFNDGQVSTLIRVITQVSTSYEGERTSASIWTHFVHNRTRRVTDDIQKLLERVSQLQDGRDALKSLVIRTPLLSEHFKRKTVKHWRVLCDSYRKKKSKKFGNSYN